MGAGEGVNSMGAAISRADATIAEQILALEAQIRGVILAHDYQVPAIQDLEDFVSDSLGLARRCRLRRA